MTTTQSSQTDNTKLREALQDMLSGWKYIRETHGDLYGVGWDRAQGNAEAALAASPPVAESAETPRNGTVLGFERESVEDCLQWLETESQTLDVGDKGLIESLAGFLCRFIRAAIASAAPAPVGVPPGWKLVPINPTNNMIRKGDLYAGARQTVNGSPATESVWQAMIEAAPSPPATDSVENVK